jgi:hypothetical protein
MQKYEKSMRWTNKWEGIMVTPEKQQDKSGIGFQKKSDGQA